MAFPGVDSKSYPQKRGRNSINPLTNQEYWGIPCSFAINQKMTDPLFMGKIQNYSLFVFAEFFLFTRKFQSIFECLNFQKFSIIDILSNVDFSTF
jgi:hypothetical protein